MNELRHCDLGSQARPPITITLRRDPEYAYKVILPFPAGAVPASAVGSAKSRGVPGVKAWPGYAATNPVTSSIASYPGLSSLTELSVRRTLVPVTGRRASNSSRDRGVILTAGN